MQILSELGLEFLEIGSIIVFALFITFLLKKIEIPTVLGLIIGGLLINTIFGLLFGRGVEELLFTDFGFLKALITELALAWIGYDIGNEIDINVIKSKGRKFLLVLLGEAIGAFLIIFIGIFLFTQDVGIALILGSIGMATAPAATSQVINEYGAEGELTQTVLFIIAFDDILAILFVNLALGYVSQNSGSSLFSILPIITFELILEIIYAIILGIIGTLMIIGLLKAKLMSEGTIVEWLLGTSIIILGIALYFEISAILVMFVFGAILKSVESWPGSDYAVLDEHIIKLEVLTVPIVLLFFILIGLLMDIGLLLQFTTLGIALIYFILRTAGKSIGSYLSSIISNFSSKVRNNLPFCLLTQAGVAIGLAGLAFNTLTDLGRPKDAFLVINVIGVSVIFAEILGPIMVKKAIFRSGENKITKKDGEKEDSLLYLS